MTPTIRFFSIDPRTGVENMELGRVWKHEDGRLGYSNSVVRDIMAVTVGRFGVDKAWAWFSAWGNGYAGSELVEPSGVRADRRRDRRADQGEDARQGQAGAL